MFPSESTRSGVAVRDIRDLLPHLLLERPFLLLDPDIGEHAVHDEAGTAKEIAAPAIVGGCEKVDAASVVEPFSFRGVFARIVHRDCIAAILAHDRHGGHVGVAVTEIGHV